MVILLTSNLHVGPRTDIRNKHGMLPIEACFIDDMETILRYVIDLKMADPNL